MGNFQFCTSSLLRNLHRSNLSCTVQRDFSAFCVDRHGSYRGIFQSNRNATFDNDLVEISLQDNIILSIINDDCIHQAATLGTHTYSTGSALADDHIADLRPVDDLNGMFTAAADHDTAFYRDMIQSHITAAHTIADDQIALDRHILQNHIRHTNQDIAIRQLRICIRTINVLGNHVIHNLGKLLAGNKPLGIQ